MSHHSPEKLELLKKMYLLEVYKNKLKILSKTFNHEDNFDSDQLKTFDSLTRGIQNTMIDISATL